jgi:hypothetical protein
MEAKQERKSPCKEESEVLLKEHLSIHKSGSRICIKSKNPCEEVKAKQ